MAWKSGKPKQIKKILPPIRGPIQKIKQEKPKPELKKKYRRTKKGTTMA